MPLSSGLRGLQSLHPGQSSTAVTEQGTVQQIVDIPLRGGLQDFSQIRVPQRVLHNLLETHFKEGVLALFPGGKSAKVTRQVGAGVVADSSSSMLASHVNEWWEDADGNMWLNMPSGRWMSERASEYTYWDER